MLPGKKASKFMPTDVGRFVEGPARGAKRGGLTDHLSGPHLIPNVGREAMVPGECVRRQPRAQKKAPAPQPKPKAQPEWKRKDGRRPKERSPERPGRHRGHSRERSKDRRARSSSSSGDGDGLQAFGVEDRAKPSPQDDRERRVQDQMEEEARQRFEQEQKKLQELEQVRQKNQEAQSERKKKLSGLFALTEDDIDAEDNVEAKKARIAREKARVERKAAGQAHAARLLEGPGRVGYDSSVTAVSSTSGVMEEGMGMAGNLTAADIDGRMHDHKFSKVWKDWDANKKSDPGEIARQFMKIAAIKRRGYAPGGRTAVDRSRSRSRSRSRGRR